MQYDFVCMNEECIRNQRSFFKFNIESIHIMDRHQVKPIHPLTFSSLFNTQERAFNIDKEFKGELIYAELVQAKDEAYRTVINTVKSLFEENNFVAKIEQNVLRCQNLDMNSVFSQMSEGNYQLLSHLKQFEMQKQQKNFKIFLMNKTRKLQQQAKNRFAYLRNTFLSQCNKLRLNKNSVQITSYQKPSELPLIQQKKTIPVQTISEQPKQKYNIYVKQQYIPPPRPSLQNPSSYLRDPTAMDESESPVPVSDDELQEQEEQISSKKSIAPLLFIDTKTKPIRKEIKKRKKNTVISQEVQIINQRIAIVRTCTNSHKTLLYLHQKYPLLTIIHIFDSKMARQMPVKYILNNFPQIMKITFNCYFQLQLNVFDSVHDDVLQRIKIQFKWDTTFFTEYFAFLHFPCKSIRRRQRRKKINMEQVAQLFPSNNSLWIHDHQSSYKLNQFNPNKSNNITVLNYCGNTSKYIEFITLPVIFSNIEVLILRRVYVLCEDFLKFVQINKKINTIFMSQCHFYMDSPISQFLVHMRNLPLLNKLSINNELLRLQPIFALHSLSYLNLDYCSFQNEENKDDSRYKNLAHLTKLKHLGLYDCRISSPFLGYLSVLSTANIAYLNLGRTDIDNNACQYLKKMINLRYLNLDYTRVDGEAFTDACKTIARQNIYDPPFRCISIENQLVAPLKKLTVLNLKDIAKYFPKLAYLNIAFNENINSYNFQEFKKLKTLGVDKDQYDQLSEILSPQINRYKITQSHQYNKLWKNIA